MAHLKLIFVLIAISCCVSASPVEEKIKELDADIEAGALEENDKCAKEKINECTSQILELVMDDSFPVPETIEDVQGHCNNVKNASRCIRNYFKDCTSESTRQMARIVTSGIKKRINKSCSPRGIRELLRHTECMKSVRAPLKLCYKQGIRDMYSIKNTERKNWHPLTCCFGSKGYECAVNAVRKNCEGPSVDFFIKESTQLMTELTETFCPSELVWGRKECSKLAIDLPVANISHNSKVTILPLIMDIVKEFSIDDEDL